MAYIGNPPITGNFQVCDAISVVNGQAAYTMQVSSANVSPESANHMLVSLNGILQKPGSSFTISGSTITFASNLATGDVIDFIILLGNVLDLGVPSDATVTDAKANFVSTSSGAGLQIKGDGTTDGTLQLNCSQNSHGVKIASPAHSAGQSYTLTLPTGNVTADKFLKVASVSGSGTTGIGQLSFADVSSDYVKLSSTTPSAAGSISIDGFFTSDYDVYKIFALGMSGSSLGNTRFSLRINTGGSAKTSGHYFATYVLQHSGFSKWDSNTSYGYSDIGYLHNSSGSTSQAHAEFTIFRPLQADKTTILHDATTWDNGTAFGRYSGATANNSAEAISGITLGAGAFGSGNIEIDQILVYGLKK